MTISNEEKIENLEIENKELKRKMDQLRKNFLNLKVEMEIQQEHVKRVFELNKQLIESLDIESIANSFFTYLKDVLGYDRCGIVLKDSNFFFLNDIEQTEQELHNISPDESTNKYINALYSKLEKVMKPIILTNEELKLATNNQIKSLVALPLIKKNILLGLIVLESKQENMYTQSELEIIQELTVSMPEIIQNALNFSEMNHAATVDSLTGLINRDHFETEVKKKYVEKNCAFSLIFLDINNLKRINSLYGNHTGDKALVKLAKVLKLFSQNKYLVASYGGGKFSMLLPKFTLNNAEQAANKIKNYLVEKNILNLELEYSFGIAHFEENSDLTTEKIISNADTALSSAKLIGTNKVIPFKT